MRSIIISHKGKRKNNQDSILAKNLNSNTYLYMISDGMGGYDNGEIASAMVTESISTFFSTIEKIEKEDIQKGINKANLLIRQYQEQNQSKMGATVAGVIVTENNAKLFWVGDVKIFHFRKNKLFYESKSHNLVNEIIENGSINVSEKLSKYTHVVTRSIQGKLESSLISFRELDFTPEDLIIICSDGVHNIVDGHSMEFLLHKENNLNSFINVINNRLEVESVDNSSFILISKKQF